MRRKICSTLLLIAAVMMTTAAIAQAQAVRPAPSFEVAVTYNTARAAGVAGNHFWMQGGSAQMEGRFYGGWGAVADIAGLHVANINSTGVGLDMVTATFGPRYTWSPKHARWGIFAQGLAGEAFGMNSLFPGPHATSSTASSFALKAGGGLDVALSRRLALRALEAGYLRTQLPNATNNEQNNLTLGAGVVLRF